MLKFLPIAVVGLVLLAGCSAASEPVENNNETLVVEAPTGPAAGDLEEVQVSTLPLTFPADVPLVSTTYAEGSYNVITNDAGKRVWNIVFFAGGNTVEDVEALFVNEGWVLNTEAAEQTNRFQLFTSSDLSMEVIVVSTETFEEASFVYTINEL